jgi:CRP/FNR family transcriptional regulator
MERILSTPELKVEEQFNFFERDLRIELAAAKIEHYEKGSRIHRQNAFLVSLPILLEGSLRIFRQTEDREILLYYVNKGETCMMSLLSCYGQTPMNAAMEASENSELILVPRIKVYEWQRKYASWNDYVIKTFAQRQEQLLDSFDSLAFSSIDKRIKDYLIRLSSRTKQQIISITHQELANELGTTRVVISRILKCLELEGAIELLRGAIKVKDLKLN